MRVRNFVYASLVVAFVVATGLYTEPIAVVAFGVIALGVLFMKPGDKGKLF